MKKFLIANKTQKQKVFSLYNGTLTAVQPGEYKIICMFDERAIAAYTKAATDSWVNGVFITCNPKVINKFVEDAKVQPITDVTPIQDANVQAVGTDDNVATNTDGDDTSTDVSTDNVDSDSTDDDTPVEDSTETEDTDVESDETTSDETVTDPTEDEPVQEESTEDTETDTDTEQTDSVVPDELEAKSLTELRDLCIAEGFTAKRWTKTQCLEELRKLNKN